MAPEFLTAMGKIKKNLCKWKESERLEDLDRYRAIVGKAGYFCEGCGRAARKKKWLCDPVSLIRKDS
jgi:hypothetical protein